MQSRFEEQQPLGNSGFVHSDALEQHVGKRLKDGGQSPPPESPLHQPSAGPPPPKGEE